MSPEAPGARGGRPLSAAWAGLLLCGGAVCPEMAWAKEALTLDLSAGATVSSNPFLDPAGGRAAVGVQTGADANYRIESERTTLNLGAGGQSSTWFDGRGTDLTGSVSADLQHRVSDRASVQLLGHYRYSRSAGYEYLFAPGFGSPLQPGIPAGTGGAGGAGGTGGTGTTPPIITVPSPLGPGNGAGLPPDATVIGRRIGQHAFGGAINVELRTSARSTLSLAADANEMRYSDPLLSNYRMFSQAAAYAHRLTEATTVMARMSVAEIKYANGEHDVILTPMVGVSRKLGTNFDLAVYGGASLVRSRLPDGTRVRSGSLALSAQLCGHYARRDFCISGDRQELPSALGGVRPTTSARATYTDRLNLKDTLALSLAFDRRGRDTQNIFRSQTLAGGTVRYDHRFGDRLAVFALAGYTRLWESTVPSRSEVRGTVGIAFRLGDRG